MRRLRRGQGGAGFGDVGYGAAAIARASASASPLESASALRHDRACVDQALRARDVSFRAARPTRARSIAARGRGAIARFTAIGNPGGDTAAAPRAAPVHGESSRWWILGITFGLRRIEEAVDDALARAGTTGVLRDVELVSVHLVYGPAGRHCYVIVGVPPDAGGSQ